MVNVVTLEGNLLGGPVEHTSGKGNKYYTLDLQVGEERIRVPCFQNVGPKVAAFKSGTLLRVDAKLSTRTNKSKDGTKEYMNLELRVKDVYPILNTEYSLAKPVEPTVQACNSLDEVPF